jgi:hypothetical protein
MWVRFGSTWVRSGAYVVGERRALTRGWCGRSIDLVGAGYAALLMTDPRRTLFDDLDPAAVMTAAEVAARIRVEAHSVRRATRRGELRASRTCGVRVLAADAVEWWRSQAVRPAASPERPKVASAWEGVDRKPVGRVAAVLARRAAAASSA